MHIAFGYGIRVDRISARLVLIQPSVSSIFGIHRNMDLDSGTDRCYLYRSNGAMRSTYLLEDRSGIQPHACEDHSGLVPAEPVATGAESQRARPQVPTP